MLLSSVVLSFNSERYIEVCVRGFFSACDAASVSCELFLIENGSADASVQIIRRLEDEFAKNIKVLYLKKNIGTTQSRNLALSLLKGDFVLILDSDAYINSNALKAMLFYLLANSRVGLVAPKLIYSSGAFQLSVDSFPTFMRKIKRLFFLDEIARETAILTGKVDYAVSACWLMRREVLDKVGLMDERIYYSPEDVDYCIRIWKSGYEVHYLSEIEVVHDAQELSRPKGLFGINRFTVSHINGMFYLFFKHRYFFTLKRLYRRIGRHEL